MRWSEFKMNKFCDQKTLIGVIAMMDMAFGAILFCLYFRQLMFFYVFDDEVNVRELNPSSLRLLALFPIILNGFQVLVAYHLLMSTRLIDPFRSLAKVTMWFQSSVVILAFLGLKLFLMLLFPSPGHSGDGTNLSLTLLIWEGIFKVVALYVVKNHMEELKEQSYENYHTQNNFPPPPVQFYSIYVPSAPVSPNMTPTPQPQYPFDLSRPNSPMEFPSYMNMSPPPRPDSSAGSDKNKNKDPVFV